MEIILSHFRTKCGIFRTQEKQIEEQKQLLVKTTEEVDQAKKRLEEVTLEIDKINQQLNEANVDTHESSRMQKKQELIESLKRVCTGTVASSFLDWFVCLFVCFYHEMIILHFIF